MSEKIPPMSPAGPQSAVAAPTKGRRPRGRVLVIVGALGLLVMVALVYTMYQRQASMATAQRQQVSDDGAAAVPPGDLWAVPDRQAPATSTQPRAASAQATPELDQAAADAFAAPTGVSGFGPKPKAIAPIQAAPRPQIVQLPAAPAAPASGTMVPPLQVDGADPNGQGSKAAFMDRQPIADPYLNAKREAPRSRTELKAGSVIPAIMVGGINSDLPGEIVGQVSRNVYDTATGDYLLVPAGAKVVGVYDSRVVYGQSRVLVAWERLIFPDGSSISIGGMPGTDMGGYSGFSDKVKSSLLAHLSGCAIHVGDFCGGAAFAAAERERRELFAKPDRGCGPRPAVFTGWVGTRVAQHGPATDLGNQTGIPIQRDAEQRRDPAAVAGISASRIEGHNKAE